MLSPPPAPPASRQLPLPLGPAARPPAPPPTTVAGLALRRIGPSLAPAARFHPRPAPRRILREGMGDAARP